MTVEQQARWLFRINAVTNWTLSLRGLIDPVGMALAFGGQPPNYPFVIRLWLGLVFMFGVMFWETSRDVRGNAVLIKYNWIEKLVTASAVTLGYVAGDVPARLMILIFFTNWVWIPIVFYYDVKIRRQRAASASA